jgi:hypothetical protein
MITLKATLSPQAMRAELWRLTDHKLIMACAELPTVVSLVDPAAAYAACPRLARPTLVDAARGNQDPQPPHQGLTKAAAVYRASNALRDG